MTRLILASGSETRARLLRDVGIDCESTAPMVDEDKLRKKERSKSPSEIAMALARAKALSIGAGPPVIGADQLLVCEGRLYEKAHSMDEARDTLRALRGREHALVTAVVLAKEGRIVWEHVESPRLVMRVFSDSFLEHYLAQEGTSVLSFVGCYRIEGPGAQLFVRVDGDHFAIQGLPLLPLLSALRERGMVSA
ncbi:MAG: Maf family protein [Alphaproteobacteria bacterium]